MNAFFAQHLAAVRDAFRRLAAAPLNGLLSLMVIGIALALPSAGWVILDNLREMTGSASGVQQISIFMAVDASKKDVSEIEARLGEAAPAHWRFVPKDEALKHLQAAPFVRQSAGDRQHCDSINQGIAAASLATFREARRALLDLSTQVDHVARGGIKQAADPHLLGYRRDDDLGLGRPDHQRGVKKPGH